MKKKRREGNKKGKRYPVFFLVFTAALFLTSCGVALEDRTFPLSMGVDYKDGLYQVYYGIPNLSGITGQGKTEDSKQNAEQADYYEGRTMEEAEKAFLSSQEDYLDMGHLKVILMGTGIQEDKEAQREFLSYMESKPSVAGNIYVFSCEQLGEVMEMDGNQMDSLGDYLTGILENRPDSRKKDQTDLQKLYNAWHNDEKIPKLLTVRADKDKVILSGTKQDQEE